VVAITRNQVTIEVEVVDGGGLVVLEVPALLAMEAMQAAAEVAEASVGG